MKRKLATFLALVMAMSTVFAACTVHAEEAGDDVSAAIEEWGAAMKEKCTAGCIGCKLCMKVCEHGAITVTDNLSVIDYTKCVECGKCVEKCPKKIIKIDRNKAVLFDAEKTPA